MANTQRWHPHLHCLLQGAYIPHAELSKLWFKITGTSEVVDIRIVENADHCTHYICKYASKPLDHTVILDPVRLDEVIVALKGKRLCMTFGTWRGFKLTEPLETGEWVQLGTLTEIIQQAEAGDTDAMIALDVLRIEYAPSTRGPPGLIATAATGLTGRQECFNYTLQPIS